MNNTRVSCLLLLALGGCSKAAPAEPTSSSISPSTPLDTLSDQDVKELCDWLNDGESYVPSRTELCTLNALRKSRDPMACQSERKACEADAGEIEVTCKLRPEDFVGCEADFDLFKRCIRDRAKDDELYFSGLSCSLPNSVQPFAAPPSCDALRSRCPNLGSGNDSGNEPPGPEGGPLDPTDEYVDGGRVCNDGRDIADAYWCDGMVDCFDGEDERECERPRVFICFNGYSVDSDLVCDQKDDCEDKSDELNCDDGYRCLDGRDIWDGRRCDGNRDCERGEDETDCDADAGAGVTP